MWELSDTHVILEKLKGHTPIWPEDDDAFSLRPSSWVFIRDCWNADAFARPTASGLVHRTREVIQEN